MDIESEVVELKAFVSSLKTDLQNQSKIIVRLGLQVEKLESENIELLGINIDLRTEIDELKTENKSLKIEVRELKKEVTGLTSSNQELRDKLHRKNSKNSSIPPSKDENRPKTNQSLRPKSNLKSGGQKGHKGHTLEMMSPTKTIKHIPSICDDCGNELVSLSTYESRRQIVDIPPIEPIVLEHQIYSRICACGCKTTSKYPKSVKASVSYGKNVEAYISYFSVRQYIPIKRIQELMAQIFKIPMSQGTICNKIKKFADAALPNYNWIHDQLEKSKVVGCDETGCVVNGDKAWMWAWQSKYLSYIVCSKKRDGETMRINFPNGFPDSVLVHDCYRAQFNMPAANHQLCTAHLLRELNYFIELGSNWSKKIKEILCYSLSLKKRINENPTINYQKDKDKVYREIDALLAREVKGSKKLKAFHRRLIKFKSYLLNYLDDAEIPPDNNGTEQAIRNVKVKQKVSGQFKTDLGAEYFAIIRSVIDTFIKRRQPIIPSMVKILS